MQSGAVLAGRYRLDRLLGRGGMGEVWGGRDLRLGRDVAIKVLLATDPDEDDVKRFMREATVAAGLQHPGITVVFDADAHDGRLFTVTELLSGQDLGKMLAARPGGIGLARVLDFGIQLTDALAAAHGRGIIHRDLKPANLFVQSDDRLPSGRLKVCDFGLARDLKSSTKLTRAGEIFGTPAYMAPEQWSTLITSPSADLYAVGCILYEMLTGRVPFEGPTLPLFMAQHLTQAPVPPRNLKPGIPPALNDLVLSLLAKQAADRPADAAEVLGALSRLRDGQRESPASAPAPPAPAPTSKRFQGAAQVAAMVRGPQRQVPAPARQPRGQVQCTLIRTLTGHSNSVYKVAFSPDSRLLATSSADKTARLWDVATGQLVRSLSGHGEDFLRVAFSPNGALLVTSSNDKTARLWDVATGRTIRTFTGHTEGVNGVAFSPDGKFIATNSGDKTARLWDVATGRTIRTLTGHTSGLRQVAFSPDGAFIATSSTDKTARLWSASTRRALRTFSGHTDYVDGVAFSPDGAVLATGSADRTARLWNVETGQSIRTLTGHSATVWAVAFSPDGALLATGSGDRTARLWDAATGRLIQTLTDHTGDVTGVAFSPDGTLLATAGSPDKTARLWSLT